MRVRKLRGLCAQFLKLYGSTEGKGNEKRHSPAKCTGIRKRQIKGSPDPVDVLASYVERQNLTMRMGLCRFTRLTNAFSKKLENHTHSLSLHFVQCNFSQVHNRPVDVTSVGYTLHDMECIVS